MKKYVYLLFLLICFDSFAKTVSWGCEIEFESSCSEYGCSASTPEDGETIPLFATFDSNGEFMLCMYTGCYEGQGTVHTEDPFLSISKADAEWAGTGTETTHVFIVVENDTGVAMFKAGPFVQPMLCESTLSIE